MGFRKLTFTVAALLVLEGYITHGMVYCPSEIVNQGVTQTFTTPAAAKAAAGPIQPGGQFVIPAVIKPIFQSESFVQPAAPNVPNFGGFPPAMPPPFPPVILADDGDSNWNNLLYFLIFAMNRNRNGGCGGYGGGCGYNNGYGGGCNGGCGGNCGGGGCGYGYDSYGSGCGGGCSGGCGGGYSGGCGGGCNSGCGGGYSGCIGGCNGGCGGNNGCSYNYPYPIPVYTNGVTNESYCGCGCGEDVSVIQSTGIQACNGCPSPNEINLIIRTDTGCCAQ